jgi:pyruvate/2-oxoglutarate dehydrogenase complex dihydrolipoamide acyltransferase (E2) component
VSPRRRAKGAAAAGPVRGSGPGGRIEIADIKAKLVELQGEVDDTSEVVRPYLTYAAVAGAVVVVSLAFVLGRRRGRRRSTWVEVRRV